MLLITFLGTGNYVVADYQYGDQHYQTKYYSHALPVFFPGITRNIVLTTAEAKAKHQAGYGEQWEHHHCQLDFVPIASGQSVAELWDIFDSIVAAIPQEEEVVFDITHAFRSLPILATLAVAYLRSTRGIKLHAVVYGAYEAKSSSGTVPTFDLTPMIRLLDWLSAAERFQNHVDGGPIEKLLKEIQDEAYRNRSAQPPRLLKRFGDTLRQFTDALVIGRVREVLKESPKLLGILQNSELVRETDQWAKPLGLLLGPLQEFVAHFTAESEYEVDAQLRLAQFYNQRELYALAISVYREYLVSRACELAGIRHDQIFDQAQRSVIERQLSAKNRESRQAASETEPVENESESPEGHPAWLLEFESLGLLGKANRSFDVRNDINHVGMRKSPLRSTKLIEQIRGFVEGSEVAVATEDDAKITLNLAELYEDTGTAKLSELPRYIAQAQERTPAGAQVVLTGAAPVWLYLNIGHALHGKATQLYYDSPVTGLVKVFDHSPH